MIDDLWGSCELRLTLLTMSDASTQHATSCPSAGIDPLFNQPLTLHAFGCIIEAWTKHQLQPAPHNAFVQCFASQRRVYQSAFERIQQFGQEKLSDHLWELVAGLRNQRDRKESDMAKVKQATAKQEEVLTAEKLMQIGRETRKFVLATMPPEQRLAGLAPEQRQVVLATLSPEERLAGLAPEERLAGLAPEERLAGLAPEDVAKLLEQIDQFLRQQQSSGK